MKAAVESERHPSEPCAAHASEPEVPRSLPRAAASVGCSADRLLDGVAKLPDAPGCWLWLGSLHTNGYGLVGLHYAHRLSWLIHRGPIPGRLHVLHRCDTRCCANPEHLFLGTQADNMRDMARKGRSRRGERHVQARLTEAEVAEIRASSLSSRRMSEKYGVCSRHIRGIRQGRFWKHSIVGAA
jgi:hypothetical protein